jgi:hypothetical protein
MKAFPKIREYQDDTGQFGMDLIDYFAAKAMQGLLATISYENSCILNYEIAEQSYKIAAAMMEARGT